MPEWRENLSVGVEKVDNQHKEIFKRVHNLFEACAEGRAKSETLHLIDFLSAYVIEHFNDEEELQTECSYPELNFHRQQHQDFTEELNKLKSKMQSPGFDENFVLETNYLVTQWLVNHICDSDRKFGIFYRHWQKEQVTKI